MFNITGNKWVDYSFIAVMTYAIVGVMYEFHKFAV